MKENIITSRKASTVDLEKIRTVKGRDRIASSYSSYLTDESKIDLGKADVLFFPETADEVAAIFKEMSKKREKITISGARTGIVGGCVPLGGSVISLERMNAISCVRHEENDKWFIKCQAGVTLKELAEKINIKEFILDNECDEAGKRFKEERSDFFYPIDPTEMTATIGGTVATNASGARTYKYGATREWITWIQVILANGEIIEISRGKHITTDGTFTIISSDGRKTEIPVPKYSYYPEGVKNAAGIFAKPSMDLIDLFIGSEGILGAITEVEIRLARSPSTISVIQFFLSEIDALEFVTDVRKKEHGFETEFLEFMDSKSLDLLRKVQEKDSKFIDMPEIPRSARAAITFDIDSDERSLLQNKEKLARLAKKHGTSIDLSWAGYEDREKARFKHFRHALPETVNNIISERKKLYPKIHKLGTDMAVPDEALIEMFQFYRDEITKKGMEYVIFGHIGDNHAHVNILPKNIDELEEAKKLYKIFAEKAVTLGGTVSAEHGIGKIKKEYLQIMYQKDIGKMLKVKKALDPDLMINWGSLFDLEA